MSESPSTPPAEEIPEARVAHVRRFSAVWLVPLVAVCIATWMVYQHYVGQGPLVELRFADGEGIEPGKTLIRTKSVEVGEVLSMGLSEDAQTVVLAVRIHKEHEHLLHEDSTFWVVRPRVNALNVSGLGTLLSGAYIEMEPGDGDPVDRRIGQGFDGLDAPPETPIGTPGIHITLESSAGKHLDAGTPLMYRGLEAGKIEDVRFDLDRRRTHYDAFVVAPYDQLITEHTRFWFNSGVSVDVTAEGARLEFETLETIAVGGISFGVPEGTDPGELITEDHAIFKVYPHEGAIHERLFSEAIEYILLAEKSIRGLEPGAPVEYRGVKVGEVLRTDIDYNGEQVHLLEPGSRIPVLFKIEPGRLGYADSEEDAATAETRILELIRSGLHGEIKVTNFVTGTKIIELQHRRVPVAQVSSFGGYTVVPAAEGRVDQLLVLLERTARKVNQIPLDDITEETMRTLATAQATLQRYEALASQYGEGSDPHRELTRSLNELERTLAEVTPLVRQLREQPNAVLVGPRAPADPEPTGTTP